MKILIPDRMGRVSPVFDVAREALIVDVGAGMELRRSRTSLNQRNGRVHPQQLVELGIDLLICSVISSSLEESIKSAEIEIIGQVCGSIEDILQAWLDNSLSEDAFLTPGNTIRSKRYSGNRSLHYRRRNRKGQRK